MKWKVKNEFHAELVDQIEEALGSAFHNPIHYEPQFVANLVWHLPRAINRIRSRRGVTIRSGGVFIHGQPMVRCQHFPEVRPTYVELGDLLLLRTNIVNGQLAERRAMLLQAKMFRDVPVEPDNKNQQFLYEDSPWFEYVRSTADLNGKKRRITGPDVHLATKYLLIRKRTGCMRSCPVAEHCNFPACKHGDCQSLMTAHPTAPMLSHYQDFREELLEFILGNAGKEYVSPPPPYKKDWDKVIEDLTQVTAGRRSAWMRRASANDSSSRGQMFRFVAGNCDFFSGVRPIQSHFVKEVPSLLLGIEEGLDGPPEVPPTEHYLEEFEEGGVSVIEFVVSSLENENEYR